MDRITAERIAVKMQTEGLLRGNCYFGESKEQFREKAIQAILDSDQWKLELKNRDNLTITIPLNPIKPITASGFKDAELAGEMEIARAIRPALAERLTRQYAGIVRQRHDFEAQLERDE
jgi:hypothetical protein